VAVWLPAPLFELARPYSFKPFQQRINFLGVVRIDIEEGEEGLLHQRDFALLLLGGDRFEQVEAGFPESAAWHVLPLIAASR
jgi:hypothetical protein